MAERFPYTEIIGWCKVEYYWIESKLNLPKGTDLSPIQPKFAPPNVRFEMDDCCSEWVYSKDHFDYIHIRLLMASVADWPALYREVYE